MQKEDIHDDFKSIESKVGKTKLVTHNNETTVSPPTSLVLQLLSRSPLKTESTYTLQFLLGVHLQARYLGCTLHLPLGAL